MVEDEKQVNATLTRRSAKLIDLLITIAPEQLLRVLDVEYERPKLGRPFSLPPELLEQLYADLDEGVLPTKLLAQKYKLSVASVNRTRRIRRYKSKDVIK